MVLEAGVGRGLIWGRGPGNSRVRACSERAGRSFCSGGFQRLRGAVLEAGVDPELAGREGCALTRPWGLEGGAGEANTRVGEGERRGREGSSCAQGQDLLQRALCGEWAGGSVSPQLTDSPIPLARPSTVSTRTPAWTAMDRSPCPSSPCKSRAPGPHTWRREVGSWPLSQRTPSAPENVRPEKN